MTPAQFRRLALALPEAVASAHMGHPDFRVGGRIFATLGYPDQRFAVVMLSPDDQEAFVKLAPDAFAPVKGAWGARGSTTVLLRRADAGAVAAALRAAWRRRAPRRITQDDT